ALVMLLPGCPCCRSVPASPAATILSCRTSGRTRGSHDTRAASYGRKSRDTHPQTRPTLGGHRYRSGERAAARHPPGEAGEPAESTTRVLGGPARALPHTCRIAPPRGTERRTTGRKDPARGATRRPIAVLSHPLGSAYFCPF